MKFASIALTLFYLTSLAFPSSASDNTSNLRQLSTNDDENQDHRHLSVSRDTVLSTTAEASATALVSLIPVVGGTIGIFLSFFFGMDGSNGLNSLFDSITAYIDEKFHENYEDSIQADLNLLLGYFYNIDEASSDGYRATQFTLAEGVAKGLYIDLNLSKKSDGVYASGYTWDLTSDDDSDILETNLRMIDYAMIFAPLHLALLAERYSNYADFGWAYDDMFKEELMRFAYLYEDYFNWIDNQWITWRRDDYTNFDCITDMNRRSRSLGVAIGGLNIGCTRSCSISDDLDELKDVSWSYSVNVCGYDDDSWSDYKDEKEDYYYNTWFPEAYEDLEDRIDEGLYQSFTDLTAGISASGEDCFADSDCVDGHSCVGYTKYGATPGACDKGYGDSCSSDEECDTGICNDNVSTPVCDNYSPGSLLSLCDEDDDCGGQKVCSSSQCKKISGKKCSSNKQCASGNCFLGLFCSGALF